MATIHVRTDPEIEKALAVLMADGATQSEAVREAVRLAARLRRQARMRAEAEDLAKDADDLAEMRRVQADLEAYRAW